MATNIGDAIAHSQLLLASFVRTELSTAFTLLDSARITDDPAHRDWLFAQVRLALNAIRRFAQRIKDTGASRELLAEGDKLENALRAAKAVTEEPQRHNTRSLG